VFETFAGSQPSLAPPFHDWYMAVQAWSGSFTHSPSSRCRRGGVSFWRERTQRAGSSIEAKAPVGVAEKAPAEFIYLTFLMES
jgi:hypothetical protein